MSGAQSRKVQSFLLAQVDKRSVRQGDRCRSEPLKAQHRAHSLFHFPMVLFTHYISILARFCCELCRKNLLLLEFSSRLMRSGITVKHEPLGDAPFFDRPLQALLGGSQGAVLAQEKSSFCQML